MKRLLLLIALLAPLAAHAYSDHRGRNIDSLESVVAAYTPDRLAAADEHQKTDYALACRDLAWGYLQIDGAKCVYYAKQAMAVARPLGGLNTIFDMSILIGQVFWAREQYDSARVYYNQAERTMAERAAIMENSGDESDLKDIEAMQSRLWGTLGNFYAMQDSLEQFAYYYGKAGEIFERNGWWEDCSTLHRNLGEVYMDEGELAKAREEYLKALDFANQAGDSLMIAGAMYGLGRWYQESGKTAKALKYLAQADEYYGNHQREESYARADTLDLMNAAYKQLYHSARLLAAGLVILVLLAAGVLVVIRRLKRTERELTETTAVLDETIEELRPAEGSAASDIYLTKREKDIVRLLMQDKSTKMIADELGIGYETVVWYRKRLLAKFDVHTSPTLISEVLKRGLL